MTQIDFYTNVADKAHTACRIVAKGYGLGHRIFVSCPDAQAAQAIDRLLWTTPPTGFIPHCSPADTLAALTPVVIDYRGGEPAHDEVLLNLRDEWPAYFGRFARLVEVVTRDEADRAAARSRYKFYRDRGYEIRVHDLDASRAGASDP